MCHENQWRFVFALLIVMLINGCDTSRSSSRPSPPDNGRFMDLWSIYIHCHRSEDPDLVRADAQRLSRMADVINSVAAPIPPESDEPAHFTPPVRLSVDPAAMAASCALHAGLVAQERGRHHLAREMFQTVITNFPQPPYRYYVAQAQLSLDRLDAVSPST